MKISLIGCGGIAKVHAQAIAASGQSFLSCCDEKPERAADFAARFGCKPYSSLRALLDAERPDVVHICTPHYTHVPLAIYALARGINVVLEKPATSFAADIPVLLDAAERSAAQTCVCFQNRYNAATRFAKDFLDNKRFGQIKGARAFVSWARSGGYYTDSDWRGSLNTEGTSVLINQSIHTLDLVQYLIGAEPSIVEGSTANRSLKDTINTEDTAEACLTFPSGVQAIFHATVAYTSNADITVEIVCENGVLLIKADEVYTTPSGGETQKINLAPNNAEALGQSYWGSSHSAIINDFYAKLQNGEPFWLDAKEGCKALRTCFDIVESGKRREAITR